VSSIDPDLVLSVGALTAQIQGVLGTTFDDVFVQGEISQPRRPSSGHVYLTLKDADAVLPSVIWRSTAARLRFAPEEGQAVIARGKIDVYPPHGRYQLVVRALEPVGEGALQLAFEQLRKRLEAEGLFAAERKRELPALPRRIALVTSRTGAAVRDMVTVIRRRLPSAVVLLVPARVQGDGAAEEIAAALALADASAQADVLIVGRGGGSIEDLWAFNEEVVARAIAACRTPVISAVGHETDVTIADLVADVRAATPSQAGELAVPDAVALHGELDRQAERLADRLRVRIERSWQRVEALGERPVLRSAEGIVGSRRQRVEHLGARLRVRSPLASLRRRVERVAGLSARLAPPVGRRIEGARTALGHQAERLARGRRLLVRDRRLRTETLAQRLDALSPLAVLRRGYSLTTTTTPDGREVVVKTAGDVSPGDALRTRFASGRVDSRVEAVDPASGEDA
jgi:exodeoxyribonuclease VII large subunit